MDKWNITLINKLCSVEYELNLRKVCLVATHEMARVYVESKYLKNIFL